MEEEPQKRIKVFISYASNDSWAAHRIVDALSAKNFETWIDSKEMQAGEPFLASIRKAISASDYVIILLSKNSTNKQHWANYEMQQAVSELSKRDITLLPVRLDDSEMPFELSTMGCLDLQKDVEKGINTIVEFFSSISDIDFKKLTPQRFEHLVRDLLIETGFQINQVSLKDFNFDLVATYQNSDPFGIDTEENYLVQTKFYLKSRPDLNFLRQSLLSFFHFNKPAKWLLVTNSHLTSVALEWIEEVRHVQKVTVRVIDGTELKRLLLEHNDLVQRYFSNNEGRA